MSIADWIIWIRFAMEILRMLDELFEDKDDKDAAVKRILEIAKNTGACDKFIT